MYLSSPPKPNGFNFSESFHLDPPERIYRKALRTIGSIIELWKRAQVFVWGGSGGFLWWFACLLFCLDG